ncbi:MAG: alcohol dehydrogenase [Deltaproteobacteria bacterium]|nr:alcohol dehydrogenase [Deltaproteobacteria bacterium]
MKTALLNAGNLEIQDHPTPEPGPEQARIRISSAGVCHSDLHIVRGDWAGLPDTSPVGHEAIGVVTALGENADPSIQVGDRVILGLGGTGGGYWCGACEFCLGGEPRHCAQTQGVMGTFAEEFCTFAKGLVKIPDSIGDEEAPLACGGLTAYGAVKKLFKHGVQPGSTVAIVGAAGGLGHYAVQIAKAFGYVVVGVDVGEEKLKFVESLGADYAVSPEEAAGLVAGFDGGGVHASIAFTAKLVGFDLGIQLLRRSGLFVAVGLPATADGNLELNPFAFFFKDPTLIYSAVGNVQDMRELVELAGAGKVKSHIGRTGALSELPDVFDELEAGKYVGRAVITDLGG